MDDFSFEIFEVQDTDESCKLCELVIVRHDWGNIVGQIIFDKSTNTIKKIDLVYRYPKKIIERAFLASRSIQI